MKRKDMHHKASLPAISNMLHNKPKKEKCKKLFCWPFSQQPLHRNHDACTVNGHQRDSRERNGAQGNDASILTAAVDKKALLGIR